jgi:hypothetical protein
MSIHFSAGLQRMDGALALIYVSTRHADSDFGRIRRQQQVLLAMREKALHLNLIPRLPDLVRTLGNTMSTDIPLEAAVNLGRLLNAIPPERIQTKAIVGELVRRAITSEGADVLIGDQAKISALAHEVFYDARLRGEGAKVLMANGAPRNGLATQTVAYLQSHGFEQVSVENSNGGSARRDTVIIDYSGKPYTAGLAAGLLGLPTDRIKVQRNGQAATDIEIILGADAPVLN